MALGISLEEISKNLGLNLASWRQIVCEPLFKQEVARIGRELEDRLLDSAVSDPILAKMKMNAMKAVEVLVQEMENVEKEMGGTAATRIKAADSLLDRVGYNTPQLQANQNIIFLEMSSEKLSALKGKKVLGKQPDSILGKI